MTTLNDIRYAARSLRRAPGFTLAAVLTLALSIGATTAIFNVVNSVLLRPLPFADAARLVFLREADHANAVDQAFPVSPGDFLDWRDRNRVFSEIGAIQTGGFNLAGEGSPERVSGAAISASVFPMLGVTPALGRGFTSEDDRAGAPRVAVLSHGLWERRFGGDPSILSRSVTLNGELYSVIGIAPPIRFPTSEAELWVPLERYQSPTDMHWRGSHFLEVIARLKPGVDLEQARREMNQLQGSLKTDHPEVSMGTGIVLESLQANLVRPVRPALLVLLAAVGLLLVIACANVANLMLVRASARQREFSIRAAIGAGGGRIARQLLTESLLLSLTGGALGLLLQQWFVAGLLALSPPELPRLAAVRLDRWVLGFTLLVAIATAVLFGLAPAWRASRLDLQTALRRNAGTTTGAEGRRLRGSLVGVEIALALVLLFGAGLLIRSFIQLRSADLGFHPAHLVTARIGLPEGKYPGDTETARFFDRLLLEAKLLPGAEAVGLTSHLPATGNDFDNSFTIEGRAPLPPGEFQYALMRWIDPGFFPVLGIGMIRGRGFDQRDRVDGAPVAIVNQAMARRFWPGEDPIGKRLTITMGSRVPREVVGVVSDVRAVVNESPAPTMYVPYAQMPFRSMVLAVRTRTEPGVMIESIRRAVLSLDPQQPIQQTRTLDQLLQESVAPWRFATMLLTTFAGVALLLAALGVFGVVSYGVARREREIGLRMALGARPADVTRLVTVGAMKPAVIGAVGGGLAGLSLGQALSGLLYQTSPRDPWTLGAVALVLLGITYVAAAWPARRAARVDPMVALRAE
ncbi:MAG TPA: ABC transporter permease [Gemmatimonadales bacterium]|nr:ABC transporter permease [Gemmatimonadales bacterium]